MTESLTKEEALEYLVIWILIFIPYFAVAALAFWIFN